VAINNDADALASSAVRKRGKIYSRLAGRIIKRLSIIFVILPFVLVLTKDQDLPAVLVKSFG
jgi:hypothetical protein